MNSITVKEEKIIREIEKNILDKYKEKFEAYYWPDDFVIPELLRAWASYARVLKNQKEDGKSQQAEMVYLNMSIQGLGWCIKWVSENKFKRKKKKLSDNKLQLELINFIKWGEKYHALAQNHVAWSRDFMEIRLDLTQKEIIFLEPSLEAFQFILIQEYALAELDNDLNQIIPHKEIMDYYKQENKRINRNISHSIEWNSTLGSKAMEEVLEWCRNTILPELADDITLDGYTLGELRIFFATVYLNTCIIIIDEDRLDYATDLETISTSFPVVLSRKEINKLISTASGLSEETTQKILFDFIFDVNNFHSNLTNQPFIKIKNGSFVILPRLFNHINLNRTIAGAFNKGRQRASYNYLINLIEKRNVEDLEKLFMEYKYKVWTSKSFKSGKKIITPDFILYDDKNNHLFILDYKHFLSPLNATEALFKISEINKGIRQLDRYEIFIKSNISLLNTSLGNINKGYSISKILLCKSPIPVPIKPTDTFIVTVHQIKKLLRQSVNGVLKNNLQCFKNDFFKTINDKKCSLRTQKLSEAVGDWSYSRTVYVA